MDRRVRDIPYATIDLAALTTSFKRSTIIAANRAKHMSPWPN